MDGGKNFDPQNGLLKNSNGRFNVPSCFLDAETGTQIVKSDWPIGIASWHDFICGFWPAT